MTKRNQMLRIVLIILWMCHLTSSNAYKYKLKLKHIEVRSNFPLNEEQRAKDNRRFVETEEDKQSHERRRRALGCCSFTNSPCVNSSYRTMDGSCNNIHYPCQGVSAASFARFLPPQYEDGLSSPRGTGRSPALPRPRDVSAGIISVASTKPIPNITLMCMQWGQWVDHDLAFTPDDGDAACCSNFKNATKTSESCLPIDVAGDSVYSPFAFICLPFVRSKKSFCSQGFIREQINELTSYLDGSQVYGSTITEVTSLRMANSYLMKFGPDKENSSCSSTNPSYRCLTFLPVRNSATGSIEFFGGDRRVEEQPGLTALHTIFVRFHNDIADVIDFLHSNSYTNDKKFEETRKIVGSVIQQITYGEFLPIVLGPTIMAKFNLVLSSNTGSTSFPGYCQGIDATIPNIFATAAFRFGHSLIKNVFTLPTTTVELCRSFNNHAVTTVSGKFPSDFMRGICSDPSEAMDHILVDAVFNKLFAPANCSFGQDLYARNIQRGREHGLAGYVDWCNACNDNSSRNCSDLHSLMPTAVANKLLSLYNSVYDIDVFPASIAENSLPDGLLGPTFACILGEVFFRLKFGDRYWFENTGVLTSDQRSSIHNTTLASLICLYTGASQLQENVFLPVSTSNPTKSCSDIIKKGVVNDITLYW